MGQAAVWTTGIGSSVCIIQQNVCNAQQCTQLVAVSAGINRQRAAVLATGSSCAAGSGCSRQQCTADSCLQQAEVTGNSIQQTPGCSRQQCAVGSNVRSRQQYSKQAAAVQKTAPSSSTQSALCSKQQCSAGSNAGECAAGSFVKAGSRMQQVAVRSRQRSVVGSSVQQVAMFSRQ